ncbi:MAG: TonB-dependent receptor [Sphingomonadales bacterium]|nr:TonB-dependent receptor [Sphingomonadales bacterium]MDE2170101.1 TonB-dependent receptor [Sphingomonadales bacterium]
MTSIASLAALSACLAASSCLATPAFAEDVDIAPPTIIVTGQGTDTSIDQSPATHVTVDAAQIATQINAVSVEDTLKYAPSLVIRKRSQGDNFAPIATRTSGLGSSARSLIYADGALLSALIANNNGNGSPRWSLVTPAEIASVDVAYGPFSAALPGNSIGTTVNITTRMPDHLDIRASVLANVQSFSLYGTDRTLPSWQYSVSAGDKIGDLSFFVAATRLTANAQPISFATLAGSAQPSGTTGGYGALSKTGTPIRVLGATGLEHHIQDSFKVKLAYDLRQHLQASYALGIWRDDTRGGVESYDQNATTGAVSYATSNNGATTGFNSGLYTRDALHFSHVVTLKGDAPKLDWQVTGTLYTYAHDVQNNPSPDASGPTANPLPAAFTGGYGTIQRQDGTGWGTLDAKAALREGAHTISFGAHGDRETLSSSTYGATNWLDDSTQGVLRASSQGKTRTLAIWAQDKVQLAPALALTLGARQEWWRAWGGYNDSYTATSGPVTQPIRTATGFSPKASVEWRPASDWTMRLSAGQAFRFPTVGELYQTVTVGTLLANPNPNLAPERARSEELAIEKHGRRGLLRISLFNEVIDNALISQTGTFAPPGGAITTTSFVQNVDRTRARGVELVAERNDIVPGVDVSASLTYADAITSKDSALPAAQGAMLPSVPRWKGNAVITWRPAPVVSLTGAMRFASRNYANLDNSDTVGDTYTGFYHYLLVDMRAVFHVNPHMDVSAGVDNLFNQKYFLYHPFPQRSFTVQANWKL